MAAKKCLICNSPFRGRVDAKTCSPRCRKRLQQLRFSLAHDELPTNKPGGWRKAALLFIIGLFGFLCFFAATGAPQRVQALTAANDLNFQGRLLNAGGAVVPDGNYNMDFKIYNADSTTGTVGTCTGACLWEESHLVAATQGVSVTNGYFSVNLGAITAFSSTINWDQQLYLTMNVTTNGTTSCTPATSCTWNGEMQNGGHSIALTSVPLAFRANQLAVAGTNEQILQFGSSTFGQTTTISLPDPGATTANICYSTTGGAVNGTCAAASGGSGYIQNQTASLQQANFRIQSALSGSIAAAISGASGQSVDIFDVNTNGNANPVFGVNNTGSALFRAASSSTTAFQVQDTNGNSLFNLDTTTANTNNKVANPSFETAVSNWSAVNGGSAGVQSSAQAYEGSKSLLIATNTTAGGGGSSYSTGAGYLASTTTYTLSAYVKTDSALPVTTFEIGRSDTGLLAGNTACLTAQSLPVNGGWQRFSCTFTTGTTSGSPYIYFKVTDAVNRNLYIDDVLLQTDAQAQNVYRNASLSVSGTVINSPIIIQNTVNSSNALQVNNAAGTQILAVSTNDTNLIANPGFETNLAGGSGTGWTANGANTKIRRDTSVAYSGVASLQVAITPAAAGGAQFNLNPVVTAAGTTYTVSFYIQSISGSIPTMQVTYDPTGAAPTTCNPSGTVVTAGWLRMQCTVSSATAPGTGGFIRIAQTNSAVATWNIDGVQMEAASVASAYGAGSIALNGTISTPLILTSQNASVNAFQIQNAVGVGSMFNVDTLNNRVTIGDADNTSAANSTLLVVDSGSTANRPTAVNGGIFYDSQVGHFVVVEGGSYKVLCNQTDAACGSGGGSTTDLQGAYNNTASSPATITTTSGTKTLLFKAGGGFDAVGLFQVQNSNGNQVISIDTSTTAASNTVTLGKASTLTGRLTFANSSNSNGFTLFAGATGAALSYQLPTADAGSGNVACLQTTGGTGVLTFGDCSGTGGGGAGNANRFLSNLQAPTAVSASLIPGSSAALDLGSASSLWRNLYVSGSVSTAKGTDVSTTGVINDASFVDGSSNPVSLIRLTGASTQTIAGIANGRDGYILTIINAASQAAIIQDQSVSTDPTLTNKITTGTGANYSLPAGASIQLVYDTTAQRWRVASAGSGGTGASTTLATAYTNGSSSANQTLALASGNGGGLIIQDAGTTVGNLFRINDNTNTTAYLNVTNSTISTADNVTFTAAAGATISTNGASGDLTVQANAARTLTLNTGGAGTVNLGTANTTTIGIGSTAAAVNLDGSSAAAGIQIGNSNNTHGIQIGAGATGTNTIIIGTTNSTSSTTIKGGVNGATEVVSLQAASSGVIGIGNTAANTINIGTGAFGDTIAIGNSTANTSASITSGGTGNITLKTNGSAASTIVQSGTNSGTAFQVQNSVGAPVLLVDTTATDNAGATVNYLSYPGFESGSFSNAAAGWAAVNPTGGTTTLTQNNNKLHTYNGLFSASVAIGANTGGGGGLHTGTGSFVSAPPGSATYIVSFYAKINSGTIASNAFTVTTTGGAGSCSPAAGITINANGFQRLFCSLTAGAGSITDFKISDNVTTLHTLFIDSVQMQPATYDGNAITTPTAYQFAEIQLRGAITNPLVIANNGDSVSAFQVQATSGNTVFAIDTLNAQAVLGTSNKLTGKLIFNLSGSANQVSITSAAQANNVAISIPADTNTSDNICLQSLGNCGSAATGGNFLVQVPTSNTAGTAGANTVSPTGSGIVALTLNGTTHATTAADVLDVNSGVNTGLTSTNGIQFNQNSAGTTTNGILINRTTGTLTNGLVFQGTIGTDITTAAARALSITGNAASTWQSAGGLTLQATTGNVSLLSNAASSSVTIDAGTVTNGIVNLGNSTAGTIAIGGGSGATTTIGGGAAAHTVNIANASGANNSTVSIANGVTGASNTATVTIGSNNAAGSTTTLNGGNGSQAILLQAATTGSIVIGSQSASTNNTIVVGNFGASTNTDNISINNTSGADTSTITIGGSGNATGTLTFGQSTGSQTLNIGSGNGSSATQVVNIAGGTSSTSGSKTVNIANGAPGTGTTNAVNIGTGGGAGAGTVGITIGSNAAAGHTLVLQGGNGTGASAAIKIQPNAAGDVLIAGAATTGAVTIGAAGQTGAINIGQTSSSSTNQTINIGTTTGGTSTETINIGTSGTATSISNILIGSAVASGGTTQVQSAGGLILGKSSSVGGTLIFDNTGGTNTVSLAAQTTNPASSVIIQLPTVGAVAGNCLQSDTGSTTTNTLLKFGSCSGSTPTLAAVYAAGTNQASSTISLDSTRLGVIIQDNASPITGNLFAVQNFAGNPILAVNSNGQLSNDTFTRSIALNSGWGSANAGGAWTTYQLTTATNTDFGVNGTQGQMNLSAANSDRTALLGSTSLTDFDITAEVQISSTPTGSGLGDYYQIMARTTTASSGRTGYRFKLTQSLTNAGTATIYSVNAGVETQISSAVSLGALTPSSQYWLRARGVGTSLSFKVWANGTTEPAGWQTFATDSTYTTGVAGVQGFVTTGGTNLPTILWDNYSATNVSGAVTTNETLNANAGFSSFANSVIGDNVQLAVGTIGTETSQLYVSGSLPSTALATVTTDSGAHQVVIQGHYAYQINYTAGTLQIIDITNPASPATLYKANPGGLGAPGTGIEAIYGHYLYIGNQNGGKQFEVIDVSVPTNPVLVNTVSSDSDPHGFQIVGHYMYVPTFGSSNLQVYDVANPANPVKISDVNTGGNINSIAVQNGYAFLTDYTNGKILVYNVSNPYNPLKVAATASTGASGQRGIVVSGRYAYSADYNHGNLDIWDVSNPAGMNLASPTTTVATGTNALWVAVQGRYAYVSNNGAATVSVIDISNPASPIKAGDITSTGAPGNIAVDGRYLYVPTGYSTTGTSLQIFDIGGAYVQQLQSGGLQTGTLNVDDTATFASDVNIQGGLSVGGGATFQNPIAVGVSTDANSAFLVGDRKGNTVINVSAVANGNLLGDGNFEGSSVNTSVVTPYNGGTGGADTLSTSTAAPIFGSQNLLDTTTALANRGIKFRYGLKANTNYTFSIYADVASGAPTANLVLGHQSTTYSTGTVTVSAGTVTGANGTNWTAGTNVSVGDQIVFSDGQVGVVTVVGSTTSLTIAQTSISEAANTTYTIERASDCTAVTPTTTMTRYSCSFTTGSTPDGNGGVYVRYTSATTAFNFNFDGAQLEYGSNATAYADPGIIMQNLAGNAGFEQSTNGWVTRSVTGTATASSISQSNDFALYGNSDLKFVTGTGNGDILNDSVSFYPNTQYTANFWARKDTTSDTGFSFGRSDRSYSGDTAAAQASQATTTVTGTNSTFTAAMVGGTIVYANGDTDTITAFISATQLTVTRSATESAQAYTIYVNTDSTCNSNGTSNTTWTINTTWTQFTCTFTTGATVGPVSSIYLRQTNTTSDNIYIDGVTLSQGSQALVYAPPADSIEVNNYLNNVTLNAGNSGDIQPWTLSGNTLPAVNLQYGAATYNGYAYIVGGTNNTTAYSTAYYAQLNADGTIGSFTATSSLPVNLQKFGLVIANGYIYAIGGAGDLSTVYYTRINANGTLGTWNTTTSIPVGLDYAQATAVNGYIYVAGGTNGGLAQTGVNYAKVNADGTLGPWTAGTALPGTREKLGLIANNNFLYILGGDSGSVVSPNTYYTSINPSTGAMGGSWTQTTSLPDPMDPYHSVVSLNGKVYIIGNYFATAGTGGASNQVYYANFISSGGIGSWSTSANPLPVTARGIMPIVSNGYIYVMGGAQGAVSLPMNSIYVTSTSRVLVGGSLDLLGLSGQALGASGDSSQGGGVGGSLTAGNTQIVGSLQVQGAGTFSQGISVNGLTSLESANVSGGLPATKLGSLADGNGNNGMTVSGRYAYTADLTNKLFKVIDISNPASPVDISTNLSLTGSPENVVVLGHYAYVVTQSTDALDVIDISNPHTPTLVGTTSSGLSTPFGLYAQGRYVYVTNQPAAAANSLNIYDVSNPNLPVLTGTAQTDGGALSNVISGNLKVSGNYAYVLNNTANQLEVFNVSNPSSPVSLGQTTTDVQPRDVYVQGRYAYITSHNANTLKIYDVSNPASIPAAVGSATVHTQPQAVYVQGHYAYVTNQGDATNGLEIVNVSNPANPISVDTVTTDSTPFGLAVSGRYAYVQAKTATANLDTFDLGGAYVQQLEAGGAEFGTLVADSNAMFASDVNIQGGLTIGQSINVNEDLAVGGNVSVTAANGSLLSTTASTANTNNKVANPSFETTISNWSAVGTGAASQSSAQAYEGNNSLLITSGATEGGASYSTGATTFLSTNTTYTLSAFVKTDSSTPIHIDMGDEELTGTLIPCLTGQLLPQNGGWQRFTCTWTTSGTTPTNSFIYFKQTSTDPAATKNIYVDDVLLQTDANAQNIYRNGSISLSGSMIASPVVLQNSVNSSNALQVNNAAGTQIFNIDTTDTNLIANPGFETNLAGAAGTGWTALASTTIRRDTTTVYSGVGSLQVKIAGATTGGAQFNLNPVVTAVSTTYTISFYSILISGTAPTFQVTYDSTGANALTCSPGGTLVTGGWQRFSCSIAANATAPTTSGLIKIAQTNSAISTWQIDAVQMEAAASASAYGGGALTLNGVINSPVTFADKFNATTAFQIQNNANLALLTVDSLNNIVQIGSSTAGTNGIVLGLNNYTNGTTEPTEVDGAMYYNSNFGQFRCGTKGAWETCGGLSISNTATTSCTNTVTPTSCTPNNFFTGAAPSIPANYCVAGRVIHVHASGIYSGQTAASSMTFSVRLAGTIIGAASGATSTGTVANMQWGVDFYITCDSTTTVTGEGWAWSYATAGGSASLAQMTGTGTTTVTNTSAQAITLFVNVGATADFTSITLEQFIVQGQ